MNLRVKNLFRQFFKLWQGLAEYEIKLALKKLDQETKEHALRLQHYINLVGYDSPEDSY
ncbi:MAG: hypothetical protein WC249_01275 [Patescibacteria group bacterium]